MMIVLTYVGYGDFECHAVRRTKLSKIQIDGPPKIFLEVPAVIF